MSNVSQHAAAELWELARDHFVSAAKLEWMSPQVSDPQLRSTLEQHARRFRQVGQELEGFLGGRSMGGSFGSTGFYGGSQSFSGSTGFQSGQGFQTGQSFQSGQGFQSTQSFQAPGYQTSYGSFGSGQSIDTLIVADCLQCCKAMAVSCIIGATEASQPARSFLHQLAGEHLQMAEQHYHWLEQRGMYFSPKADQQAIQGYTNTLNQIAQAGQSGVQSRYGGGSQYATQATHTYGTGISASQYSQQPNQSGSFGHQ